MQLRPRQLLILSLLALLAAPASAQPIDVFTDVSFHDFTAGVWEQFLFEGPFLDDQTATGIASVDLDPATPRPELLVYQGTTITWYDLELGTSGTISPAPPVPVDALVGLQVLGTPAADLVLARGSDLWALDLAAPSAWIGPFPQTFAAASLAAADVLGGAEEELIASDGTQVFALDLAVVPLAWTTLLQPPGPVDSIAGVDVAFLPPAVVGRLLAAHVGDTTHYYLPASLVAVPSWSLPQVRRFGVSSAAPIDRFPTAPDPLGNMLVPTPLATSSIRLADVAASVGLGAVYQPGGDGHCPGAVFTDLDGDRDADLYLVRGDLDVGGVLTPQTNLLFDNDGSGRFVPLSGLAADGGNSAGALAADFTGDGLRDLYVANFMGPNRLYQRTAAGGYLDITPGTDPSAANDGQAGLAVGCAAGESEPDCTLDATLAVAAGDIDRDGDLDLYVGNQQCCAQQGFTDGERDVLYLNNGDLTFTDITVAAGIEVASPVLNSSTQAVLIADFDNDLWPDIYVTHKGIGPQRDQLFINRGDGDGDLAWDGKFDEYFAGQPDPDLGSVTCAAMGIDAADYDNDGDLDIFLTDISGDGSCADPDTIASDMDLYRNRLNEDGGFGLQIVRPNPVASPDFAWGTSWSDLDNDGDQELHVSTAGGQMNWLHRNDAGSGFADVTVDSGAALAWNSRTSVPADFDRDGRMDLLVAHRGPLPVTLLQNRTPLTSSSHWLEVSLTGDPTLPGPFRSTRDAVGARINVTVGDVVQRRDIYAGGHSCGSTRDYVAHFGVGTATVIDRVEVIWPSGRTSVLTDQAADQVLPINE